MYDPHAEEDFNYISFTKTLEYYLKGHVDDDFESWIKYVTENVNKFGTAVFDQYLEKMSNMGDKWKELHDNIIWEENEAIQCDKLSTFEHESSCSKINVTDLNISLCDKVFKIGDEKFSNITLIPAYNNYYRIQINTTKELLGINCTRFFRYIGSVHFNNIIKLLNGKLERKTFTNLIEDSAQYIYMGVLSDQIKNENNIILEYIVGQLFEHKDSLLKT